MKLKETSPEFLDVFCHLLGFKSNLDILEKEGFIARSSLDKNKILVNRLKPMKQEELEKILEKSDVLL